MESIRLENIAKTFTKEKVIDDLTLTIEPGQFVTLLGPSGCGKTTLLRCIAGLEQPDDGRIFIGDRKVFSAPEAVNMAPKERRLSMVFQTYAVWPHMTVFENVSFGLELQHVPHKKIEERVYRILDVVGIRDLAKRYPFEVSGGQQQRISLARALVVEPSVLLMDEPLSNLDARLRMLMRSELKRIHREMGATVVYVTHDQLEALTLSDNVVVLHKGKIQQIADPITLYDFPANLFVSNFVGTMPINLIEATVLDASANGVQIEAAADHYRMDISAIENVHQGDKVIAAVRPEDMEIEGYSESTSAGQEEPFEITDVQCIGSSFIVKVKRNNLDLIVDAGKEQREHLKYGAKIFVRPLANEIRLYDPESKRLIPQ